MLCCKHVCAPNLRKTRWYQKKIKLKEFKRRTAATKELFGKGKTDKVRPIQYEKTLSVCEEIALELNVQGGFGKAYRKSQPVYSMPLVTWTNRKRFRREGITLRSTITLPKLFQG